MSKPWNRRRYVKVDLNTAAGQRKSVEPVVAPTVLQADHPAMHDNVGGIADGAGGVEEASWDRERWEPPPLPGWTLRQVLKSEGIREHLPPVPAPVQKKGIRAERRERVSPSRRRRFSRLDGLDGT